MVGNKPMMIEQTIQGILTPFAHSLHILSMAKLYLTQIHEHAHLVLLTPYVIVCT